MCCAVLDAEKQFMEAAKRNDVATMKTLARGLNANARNVVGNETDSLSASQYHTNRLKGWSFVKH